jgi:hypothetical protein
MTWFGKWLLALLSVTSGPAGPDGEPQLRQTGSARGHLDDLPRTALCERAEDSAWELVWRSCDDRHRLENILESGCMTTDYHPADDDGHGPFITVQVMIEYDCLSAL